MADVNTSILQALEAGYHPQEIMNHLKDSSDPSHQEWYSNYTANMADRAKEPSSASIYYNDGSGVVSKENETAKPSSVSTPLLDYAKTLTPAELAGAGAATLAVIKAPSLYNAYQDRKIEKEKLSIEQRRLNAYEQQVTKQGATPEPLSTVAGQPQVDKLSPLEEAKVNTERAKAEHIQSKIALAERKLALEEARLKAEAEAKAAAPKKTTAGVAPPSGPVPENPTVPLNTEVGKPPKEMPMIEKAAGNPERNAVAEGKNKMAIVPPPSQPSLMTGSGMPAYQGTGPKGAKLSTNIPSLALVPEDKVFVPGGQFMDIIRNATGQEAYTGNLKKYGYPETPQKGYETARSINESLGRATREEAKAAGTALGENTKAITQKVGGIKGVKVGGVVGALISLTDLAKADTLRQGLGNVAEGLMPIGISPSELASGKLTEKQLNAYKEAQKLGSPYRSVPPPR
jgi:hypothetical protein